MEHSILVPLNDSVSSHAVVDFLAKFCLARDQARLTLLNVFRKPSSGEMLMGYKYMQQLPQKYLDFLNQAKERLVKAGYEADRVEVVQVDEPYETVSDGILDYFTKGEFDLIVVGRKKMSKAEEFVSGDVSVRVLRAVDESAVLVVKCR